MSLKTRSAKYEKLNQMKSQWAERFEGKTIVLNDFKYKVFEVWIQGLTYKEIFGIKFRTGNGWITVWNGVGKRPAINQIKVI